MARELVATERTALMNEADQVLTYLSPLEEFFLRRRFGIGGRPQTLEAIARRLGLNAADIRHLESRALSHLRRIASAAELEDEHESAAGAF